jgi:hypothetical protein
LLTGLKGKGFLLLVELLQRYPADMITINMCRSDQLPCQLRCGLVGEGSSKLCGHGGAQHLQLPTIIIVADATDVDHLPELSSLHLHLHEETPLMVV